MQTEHFDTREKDILTVKYLTDFYDWVFENGEETTLNKTYTRAGVYRMEVRPSDFPLLLRITRIDNGNLVYAGKPYTRKGYKHNVEKRL